MLTDRLWEAIQDLWAEIVRHPLLVEMKEGTLAPERFSYYLGQDLVYLEDFARVLAHAAILAPDRKELAFFLKRALGVLEAEGGLHESVLQGQPVPPAGPGTKAYAAFLERHISGGDYASLVTAVLPCFWVYREVGRRLRSQGGSPHPAYQRWIDLYGGAAYGEPVEELLGIVNRLSVPLGAEGQLIAIFREGVLHERRFWDQAYRQGAKTA